MTLHDHAQFEELVAKAVEEKPKAKASKPRAKPVARAAKVPAAPRAHRETGLVCDCTASRADLIRGSGF